MPPVTPDDINNKVSVLKKEWEYTKI
jgi:hypothetical protein